MYVGFYGGITGVLSCFPYSLAFSSLQSLILDFVEWREDVIVGKFLLNELWHFMTRDGKHN